MSITYTIADYTAEDKTVEVTFEDENGNYHKRTVNIPKNTDVITSAGIMEVWLTAFLNVNHIGNIK